MDRCGVTFWLKDKTEDSRFKDDKYVEKEVSCECGCETFYIGICSFSVDAICSNCGSIGEIFSE